MSDSLSVSDSVTAQLMLSSVSPGQPRLVLARLLRRDSGGWRLLEAARPAHAELWSVSEPRHLDRGRGQLLPPTVHWSPTRRVGGGGAARVVR